ncbi:hypothetical protein ACSFE6_29295, partial [Pseudomonas baetica]|uniref:hypothetical protein n=1 Tax=Pseudomonas baetica TaxID=674054 RepID=UPI003EEC18E7
TSFLPVKPLSRAGSLPQEIWVASGFLFAADFTFKVLFNRRQIYFLKATAPCVVAYGYARIRRLVRLGVGFYRWPVAENYSDRVW